MCARERTQEYTHTHEHTRPHRSLQVCVVLCCAAACSTLPRLRQRDQRIRPTRASGFQIVCLHFPRFYRCWTVLKRKKMVFACCIARAAARCDLVAASVPVRRFDVARGCQGHHESPRLNAARDTHASAQRDQYRPRHSLLACCCSMSRQFSCLLPPSSSSRTLSLNLSPPRTRTKVRDTLSRAHARTSLDALAKGVLKAAHLLGCSESRGARTTMTETPPGAAPQRSPRLVVALGMAQHSDRERRELQAMLMEGEARERGCLAHLQQRERDIIGHEMRQRQLELRHLALNSTPPDHIEQADGDECQRPSSSSSACAADGRAYAAAPSAGSAAQVAALTPYQRFVLSKTATHLLRHETRRCPQRHHDHTGARTRRRIITTADGVCRDARHATRDYVVENIHAVAQPSPRAWTARSGGTGSAAVSGRDAWSWSHSPARAGASIPTATPHASRTYGSASARYVAMAALFGGLSRSARASAARRAASLGLLPPDAARADGVAALEGSASSDGDADRTRYATCADATALEGVSPALEWTAVQSDADTEGAAGRSPAPVPPS